jgi:hypothetical protein
MTPDWVRGRTRTAGRAMATRTMDGLNSTAAIVTVRTSGHWFDSTTTGPSSLFAGVTTPHRAGNATPTTSSLECVSNVWRAIAAIDGERTRSG